MKLLLRLPSTRRPSTARGTPTKRRRRQPRRNRRRKSGENFCLSTNGVLTTHRAPIKDRHFRLNNNNNIKESVTCRKVIQSFPIGGCTVSLPKTDPNCTNEFTVDQSGSFGIDTSQNETSLEGPGNSETIFLHETSHDNESSKLTKDGNVVTESETSKSAGTNADLSNVREEIQLTESIMYQNSSNSVEIFDTDKEVQLTNYEKESQLIEYFESREEESTKFYEEIKLTEAPVQTVTTVEQSTVETETNNEVIEEGSLTITNVIIVDKNKDDLTTKSNAIIVKDIITINNDVIVKEGRLTTKSNVITDIDVKTTSNDVFDVEENGVITTKNKAKSNEMSNDDNGRTIPIYRNVSIDALHGQLIKMLDNLARKYNTTN